MGRQLWLADAAREWGLDVVETNDWQSRGSSSFTPRGGVAHHTAGPTGGGDMPSLNTIINGRPDLAGPLANYGLGRSGTVYVIASGKANHAGNGGWQGLSGNSSVVGIEAENDGYQPWPDAQLTAYSTLCAAACAYGGWTPDYWCRHHEWRAEKPDPHDVDGPTGRDVIARRLAAGPGGLPPPEVSDMLIMFRVLEHADPKPTYVTDGIYYRQIWGPTATSDIAWNMAQCGMPESAQQVMLYGEASCEFAGLPLPGSPTTAIADAPHGR